MARLSIPPNFIGTPSSDTILGEELNGSPAVGINILIGGYIRTLSGKDTLTGISTGNNGGNSVIANQGGVGIGISNSGSLIIIQ
ncbi:hypothetical protein [Nostoc sp.]|uniref:hypothetical protein n=1 Tax=Nostoc sp. TaxID=1180 RepID=UPI002FFCC76B